MFVLGWCLLAFSVSMFFGICAPFPFVALLLVLPAVYRRVFPPKS
jgi:hypothetical protein